MKIHEEDKIAERELELYANNDGNLYRQREVPIMKNLIKKIEKGTYDHKKAKKLWKYWSDDASKRYGKEYGYRFTPDVRRAVASSKAKDFIAEYKIQTSDGGKMFGKSKSSRKGMKGM